MLVSVRGKVRRKAEDLQVFSRAPRWRIMRGLLVWQFGLEVSSIVSGIYTLDPQLAVFSGEF